MTLTDILTLRRLEEEDIAPLAFVLAETPAAQLRNRFREQELGWREVVVAEQSGELMGTVSMRVIRNQGVGAMHLIALEVRPDRRAQGIGRRIIEYVIGQARHRGCRRVFLDVRVDNPARRLYHRTGFRRAGPQFINTWWLYREDGTRQQIDELSVRMVKRIRP